MCTVTKKGEGIEKLSPKFFMTVYNNDLLVLSAKKQFNSTRKFEFSLESEDFSDDNVVGRMKANFLGTIFNLYDNGKSPSNSVSSNDLRQQLGSITYVKNHLPRL